MKLGKLLASGKSIMNGRTEISYRSSKQIYLPKFGSAKNPFKTEPEQSAVIAPPSAATELRASASDSEMVTRAVAVNVTGVAEPFRPVNRDAHETAVCRDASRSDASMLLPRHIEAAAETGATAGQRFNASKPLADNSPSTKAQSTVAAVQTARVPQLSKFNPFSILRGALPGGKAKDSARTAKGQKGTPTQAELSLDTVRVVHNDLSDVDVEVVPIKSRSTVPELPAPKKSWEFVGERLFGVEAT
jgi:hypothetical protein